MATLQLQLRSDVNNFQVLTELEGILYVFNFVFNFRTDLWSMDILNSEESEIVTGIPIVLGVDLIDRFSDERLPPGNLFGLNIKEENVEAGENDLNENYFIIYEEANA